MYQKLTLVGHLGGNPEMRYLPDGTAVTNFSVAVNNNHTDRNGQKVEQTTWFRVSAWNNLAENVNQYLSRGSKVLVEGTLQADRETGSPRTFLRNDGTTGASFEVKAISVVFLSAIGEQHETDEVEDAVEDDFVL